MLIPTGKQDYSGADYMKENTLVTLMVCAACGGSTVPPSIVGKAKTPCLFFSSHRWYISPMKYKDQNNSRGLIKILPCGG